MLALTFFTETKPAPIDLPPWFVLFLFDSGASCIMVNSPQYGKGWQDMDHKVSITTTNGGLLSTTKMGGMVSLLSFIPKMCQWEQITYQDCLLIPGLVTNLIGTKSVTHAQGKVTFEDELITVQDKNGHVSCVPTNGDGYPATAMIIWDNNMPKPAISLTFAAQTPSTEWFQRVCPKADLWHWQLGHASHDSILCMCTVTVLHNISSLRATHPSVLCNVCICSKATTRTVAHPRHMSVPLELVSMDIMGPMHGATKFAYVLIIHNVYLSMIWAQGLMNKGQASQEAAVRGLAPEIGYL
ncbi:hypothetical protein NDA11_006223 [Ustilago hordei]|nr:hypothetical protein NDA11_006223 [Ustilago hordei]